MSDWWQRHLGRTQPLPATQPTGYPAKAVRWQDNYPPTGPRQELVGPETQPEGGDEDSAWARVQRQGFVNKAPSSRGQSGTCPRCGGSNFFRRKGAMGMEAAPLCTECGYNGDLFEQSGTLLNAVGMKSSGPVQFARTDNPRGESNFEVDPGVPQDFNWGKVR